MISTVKDRSVFVATPDIQFSQLFFPIKGILAVYDRETGEFQSLPGADDPQFVQSNPSWSPDGQQLVFARSKAYHKPRRPTRAACCLRGGCREFVEEESRSGSISTACRSTAARADGRAARGASGNGMSNYFARFSPDGQWIVFCKAKNFMLLQPDSELYIIPAEGGQARRLRCNTPRMNSWHSCSSNGRWLVFSSKASALHAAVPDAHRRGGREHASGGALAIHRQGPGGEHPGVCPVAPDAIAKIQERSSTPTRSCGPRANERTGDYPGAIKLYRRGLEIEPQNVELLNAIGFALFQQGKSQEATVELEKAIAIDPKHWKSHNNLALASIHLGELELAEAHYRESLAIQPQPAIYNDLGVVQERLGLPDDAAASYRKALELVATPRVAHTEPRLVTGAKRQAR